MVLIEEFLYKMPPLKHLELEMRGNKDLIDGQRWESLISHLINFPSNIISHYSVHQMRLT